jgi:hypothetical protein
MTDAPAAASTPAKCRPSPLDAPVTSAVRPASDHLPSGIVVVIRFSLLPANASGVA